MSNWQNLYWALNATVHGRYFVQDNIVWKNTWIFFEAAHILHKNVSQKYLVTFFGGFFHIRQSTS